MKNIKLKACPFCGEQPAVFPSGDGTGEMVECQTPGCVNPHVSYYGKNVARQKWNARAGDREPEDAQSEAAVADSLKRVVRPCEWYGNGITQCGEPSVAEIIDAHWQKGVPMCHQHVASAVAAGWQVRWPNAPAQRAPI